MKKYIDMSLSELEERTWWGRIAVCSFAFLTVVCAALNVLYTMPLAIVVGFAMLTTIFSHTLGEMNLLVFWKRHMIRSHRNKETKRGRHRK